MKREGLRRLELWLPVDHPLWRYPSGTRARTAVTMLDAGMLSVQILARLEERMDRLAEQIAGLAERIIRIEEALKQGSGIGKGVGDDSKVMPDPGAWLDAWG